MLINKEKAIVIAVDYQERLIPAMSNKEELIANSVKLLKGMRIIGVPVLFTQQYTKGLGTTIPEITEAAGTDTYFEKIAYSGFEVVKEALGTPEEHPYVILCGIEAHCCILQTAIELMENGYQAILAVDCTTSRKSMDLQIALERAKQEGVLLTTTEAILFELLHAAGTPTAKEIQKLIK